MPTFNHEASLELLMIMLQVDEEDIIVIPFSRLWSKTDSDNMSRGTMMDDYIRPVLEEFKKKEYPIYCRPLDWGNFAFSWRYIDKEWIAELLPQKKQHSRGGGGYNRRPRRY